MTPSRADAEYAAITIKAYCQSKVGCEGCFMCKNCHDEDRLPENWLIGGKDEDNQA